jgi:cytosine/creatinine deaminase
MNNSWDLRQLIVKNIQTKGGWVNTHTHLDRAFTITPETLYLADEPLQKKWDIVDEVKRKSSVDDIYDRMAFAIERQIAEGVTVIGSFIDVDEVVQDKSMVAAQRIKDSYKNEIVIKFINQSLKGVLEPVAHEWFQKAVEFVDIIGGLPGKDKGREEEHLDVLFTAAKKANKMIHVHVDQLNIVAEKETELLVTKTKQYNYSGKVAAIHGISLAAHPKSYRDSVYKQMKEQQVMLISCPTAWIDSRRSENKTVTHNSIAPVEELVAAGITVGIGTDNIADVYKPFTDGAMWTELRFLLESCHYYNLDELIKIATTNGRQILGV